MIKNKVRKNYLKYNTGTSEEKKITKEKKGGEKKE